MARTSDATSGASVSTDPGALIEAYYDAGWTDGLPVVPPTDASIADMLKGAGLRGDEVLGEIAGRNTVVVADKVAINAVMAGCRPEYLPVVVAAVRGLCHPDFAYHGPASSTGGSAMVLIVNGPVAQRLGINGGNNAFGQGHRPNATSGRARQRRRPQREGLQPDPGGPGRRARGDPARERLAPRRRPALPARAHALPRGRPQARGAAARRCRAGRRDDMALRVRVVR